MKLTLRNVRLSFPTLWEPEVINGQGEPKFSAAFLLPRDHKQIAEFNAAVDQVAKDKWAAKSATVLKASKAKDRHPLHDGDTKTFAGFEGQYYVNASNLVRPKIKDRDGKADLIPSDGKPYAGCYVNAIIELYAQDNKHGQHVNCTLLGVQFVADGEAFAGGGTASDDDFEDLGGEDEDDLS
jgi:hypothetical protein